ncbi:Qat anti-phage system QueC-like protein QatC [Longitalea luteola]|uniref:Qat anti-phage system QueC-like protein QatC n=1 Tax=Longitalea luteola TaxID=2812563 RepID=UPI001A96E0F3|nr:Qat anti-phage system QueC-like protein QatC [Longitalea luteola]
MGKFALIGRLGTSDPGVQLAQDQYARIGHIDFMRNGDRQDVSLKAFLKGLRQLKLTPTERAMDLLIIACMTYAEDTRINREKYGQDSWTRIIELYIPVSDPAFWQTQTELLGRIFRFLSGDIWTLHFRARAADQPRISPIGRLQRYQMPYQTDTVCLFSGGMDSFIGAIDLLRDRVRPLLVGHSKSSDVTPFQQTAFDAINNQYPHRKLARIYSFIRIPKKIFFEDGDHTERGRSFLFLSLGMITASSLGAQTRLVVPENGMISLNIPLTPLRIGSHSTRTTHPHYLEMMRELSQNMGIGVAIVNPYQFKTKGEMLQECANMQLVEQTNTMSCSHPSGRYFRQGNGHCGYCVPCIIRQSAYLAAGAQDCSIYRTPITGGPLQVSKADGTDVLAFKYLIAKVQQNPDYIKAAIRSTGPLGTNIDPYIDVYSRALREVDRFISQIQLT